MAEVADKPTKSLSARTAHFAERGIVYESIFGDGDSFLDQVKHFKSYYLSLFGSLSREGKSVLQEQILPVLENSPPETWEAIVDGIAKLAKEHGASCLTYGQYLQTIETQFKPFIETVNSPSCGTDTIVFISYQPHFVILREAMSLRRKGFKTFLLSVEPIKDNLRQLFEDQFDGISHLFHKVSLLGEIVRELQPRIFHVECWMTLYPLSKIVIENKGDASVVCEFYDITSIYAEPENLYLSWPKKIIDTDIETEKYILNQASAIVHRYPQQVAEEWLESHGEKCANIEFQSYSCQEFTAYSDDKLSISDGVIRAVFAGGLVPFSDRHAPELYPELGMIHVFRHLLELGMEVNVFHSPHSTAIDEDHHFRPYMDLAEEFPRFKFLGSHPPDQLAKEICIYDFGILLSKMDFEVLKVTDRLLRGAVGTKLFSYLEAGLPVIVNAEYVEMARIVTENGLGIAITSHNLDSLEARIKNFDYKQSVKNIRQFNDRHNMDGEISRLVSLYEETCPPVLQIEEAS